MNTGWMVVLLAAGVVIATVALSWRRRINTAELGAVTSRWIAEHRASEPRDAGR
jgi:hypothetical protein